MHTRRGLIGGLALVVVLGCVPKQVDTTKSDNRVNLAEEFLRQHKLDEAESEAKRALTHEADNEEAFHVLGLVEFLRGVNNFLLLEQQDCATGVDAEVLRAEVDKHFANAEGYFEKATALAPDYGEAWSSRGALAMQMEEYDQALDYFEMAIEQRHRLVNVGLTRANAGWAHFHLGRAAEAARDLRQALQFQPKMCVALYRLGRVYFSRQEWGKALDSFTAVAEDSACRLQEARLYQLRSLATLGRTSELAAAKDACIALAPRSCVARECQSIAGDRVALPSR